MVDAWEASVEAQIRSAQERGEFDNLPGMGKPIPGRDLPYDESWWITSFLEREALPTDLLLPTPLQLRRRVEQVPDEVRDLPTEESVREFVGLLNQEIVTFLRYPSGPRVAVRPVDTEAVLRGWRAHRAARAVPAASAPMPAPPARRRPRWRWPWRRPPG
ncbi:DnaJ family domain-containing protein [Micromonospora wenchangensis]|uniref:DnaJ family domain-containing protein n=1 Tax=Micromonospora wenchangensis TaxID=1185415 RepID=UPI0037F127EB